MMRGFRRGLMLLATGSILATAAAAQDRANVPRGAIVQPLARDDGSELRGYLTTLADNPRSVDALVGAGRAAMRMGDVEAALTFFGRADGLSPRDARVKAGMASGLLQMGQPQAALSLFAEAIALGAPEAEIAGDRGLAFDLVGDPQRAQRDYLLALRGRNDPEVRRRMALSLAISGRRDAALRLIDDQLRANDRAGWRTQAFVLALTGDAAGASQTARGVMLPGQAEAMAPFLARLATLNPAQKAMAVHLGRFPTGGQAMGGAGAADVSADPGALALAMGGAPAAVASPPAREAASSNRRRADRRRDASEQGQFAAPRSERRRRTANPDSAVAPAPTPTRAPATQTANSDSAVAPAPTPPRAPATQTANSDSAVAPAPTPPRAPATQTADAGGRWSGAPYQSPQAEPTVPSNSPPASQPPSRPAQPQPQQPTSPRSTPASPGQAAGAAPGASNAAPARIRAVELPPSTPAPATAVSSTAEAAPGFSLETAGSEPARAPVAPPAEPTREERPALADIAELVRTLPPEEERRRASPFTAPPPRPAPVAETARAPARPARAPRAQPAHPSRHWVQIAGGANRAALPREFTRLREQAPDQLGRRVAYTATLRATNRLLVGPFDSAREAQEFVNQLARHNVSAFAWTSEAGEAVERLPAR
jgi:Flp pilus assembly protein TadD